MKLFSFSKETTLVLKGIAVLMMVMLHLFNRAEYYSLCHSYLYIDGTPLINRIALACNPVGFFCFLSGYGIYYSCRHLKTQNEVFAYASKRVFKLYLSLWLLFLIFIPLCSIVNPELYPGSLKTSITNIFAYTNTWNHTTWFVLPFTLVLLTCCLWIKLLDTKKKAILLGGGIFLLYYIVAIVYGRFWDELTAQRYLLICCRTVELLAPFAFGAIIQRFSHMEVPVKMKDSTLNIVSMFLACAMFVYSILRGIPLYPVYCAVFMIVLANIRYGQLLCNVFRLFGKYSMIIWLTHTFYFEVLFKNQIFALQYPVLIFIVVSILSLIAAMLLDKIVSPVIKSIK